MSSKATLTALMGAVLILIPSAAMAQSASWDEDDEDAGYSQPYYAYDEQPVYVDDYDDSYNTGYGKIGFSITFGTGSGYTQPYYNGGYDNEGDYGSGYYGNSYYQNSYPGNEERYYRSRSHYGQRRCGSGTTGTIVGGAVGALVGREIGRSGNEYRDRYRSGGTTGAIVGGAAGALAGRAIDQSC